MRKISWLAMGCVAAYVAQALVAADSASTLTSKDPTTGRSRLLIFSRNKDKARVEEEPVATAKPVRPSSTRTAGKTPAASNVQSVDTGTISPRTALSRQTPPAAHARVTGTSSAPTQQALAPSEDDDELIRKLFESDELVATPNKQSARPAAGRIESKERVAAETAAADDATNEFEVPAAELPKVNRYRELLESQSSAKPRTAATGGTQPDALKKGPIKPVSDSTEDKADLEVNSFEPAERPTKVINAGFESEPGDRAKDHIRPVSATGANTLNSKPKTQLLPTAKSTVTKKTESAKTAAKPTVVAKPTPAASTSNVVASTLGANQTPQVDVKWEARGEVTLGQECQCALVVHNSGKIPCRDLVVEANFPESVRLVDAVPFPKASSSKLEWQFTNLAAGEKKIIELTMVPTNPGELAASAQVRFTGTAATSFKVSEPMLATTIKLPAEVRIGDPASATVTVSNPGTGTAQNVVLKATLPSGLDCKSGKEFEADIGPLGPGESRIVRMGLIGAAGGDHALKVVAHSSTTDLETSSQASIRVLAPSLALTASGPSLRYLNRAAKYVLTATNNSNASSDNVRISQVIEPGFEFVKADHSGRWDAQRRTVSWFIGHMDPGQTATVELDLIPKETGEFRHQFRVTGDAGVEATSVVATRVEGAASLVMEVKDADDPIEVGTEMTYAIKVRNEGSKSAGKVAISCELPPDVELVSVDGPTPHIVESGMLIFKPVAEVAANDSVTFKVTIKGMAPGTMKLRARLTSESIQKPLIVEEATQFYAE